MARECTGAKNLTPVMEDYLEAVWRLAKTRKVVRVKDVGSFLGVASSTVNAAMKSLKTRRLVHQESYGYIELTPAGTRAARAVARRHALLVRFLRDVLHVKEETAEKDACRLEHCVSPETLEKIVAFLERGPSRDTHTPSKDHT